MEMPDEIDIKSPRLYLNRELSLLEFNQRVLAQARDERVPLLERVFYMCISCTNLDEFFEVRVAGLKHRAEAGSTQVEADQRQAQEILSLIAPRAHELVTEQYRIFNDVLLPALDEENIHFIRRSLWTTDQEQWLRNYFNDELLPVLTPLGLDPAHPFPRILNKSLNFIVSLKGKDAFGRNSGFAIVQAPRALPRVIQLPQDEVECGPHDYVFLTSVIHAYIDELFFGMTVDGCYQFRVTRNSDLFVDEEEVDDLLRAVEGELPSRRYGDEVRLEVADNAPEKIVDYLLLEFELSKDDLYLVNGPVNLSRMSTICDIIERPELKFPGFTPAVPDSLIHAKSIFDSIRNNDVLLHHPFQSFLPVIDFIRQAASDPNVVAIKQTLYRTGADSAIVDGLVAAARAGKEVTVVVELRARFDEEDNIRLANRLQEAGAHLVYGVVGYKTHAKILLILRRERNKLRHYTHIGTGNYHARTSRAYTDYALMTSNKAIGQDAHRIFQQLTSLGKVAKLNKMLQSPFTLFDGMIERIEREAEHARAGKPARIIAKMNSLVEAQIIQALYKASQAGVQIDLIVRGMCCLKPGVTGVSENIRVRSVVGRFLEHPRIYYFQNDESDELFCASADWMERNLFRRVETCFPIEGGKHKRRILEELKIYLTDNTQAWLLAEDGSYKQVAAGDNPPITAQQQLLEKYGAV